MNLAPIQPLIDAVLYEGYILYPYRPTAVKNRQRWTFGGIYPRAYFDATAGADPWQLQTECLVQGSHATRLEVRVRFLHPVAREIDGLGGVMGDTQYQNWQEAMEREVQPADCLLGELLEKTSKVSFCFPGRREVKPLTEGNGHAGGVVLQIQKEIQGRIELSAEIVADGVFRIRARIENHSTLEPSGISNREQASLYSFASTHTILGVNNGTFVSLMDPPETLKEFAAACDNRGMYPVLVGDPATRDTMLSSPIILYDYPVVAPESPGDLFDSTEIDEILSLRILAMTEAEKREMAFADPRAATLLARTEALDSDDFMRMHGTLRNIDRHQVGEGPLWPETSPVFYRRGGSGFRVGDRVRLCPKVGGDVMDLVLDGKTAVIEAIEQDFEDRVHVAVTVDDDPGREWGLERMPGHRFFFSPEEIEFLEPAARSE